MDVDVEHEVAARGLARLLPQVDLEVQPSEKVLIENAVRYAGGADVRLVTDEKGVTIFVEDEGPGIPFGDLEEVFTPFFRLEESRSRETGGIGLGLSIARAIARQHGGDIVLTQRDPGLRAALVLPQAA